MVNVFEPRPWFASVGTHLPRRFRFGEVDAVLRAMHRVPDSASRSFGFRLKNLKRAGLVIGVAGPGRRANLSIGDALTLAIAVELGLIGNAPEQIVAMLATNATCLARAVRQIHSAEHDILIGYEPDGWGISRSQNGGAWVLCDFERRACAHFTRMVFINFSVTWRGLIDQLGSRAGQQIILGDIENWVEALEAWSRATDGFQAAVADRF